MSNGHKQHIHGRSDVILVRKTEYEVLRYLWISFVRNSAKQKVE